MKTALIVILVLILIGMGVYAYRTSNPDGDNGANVVCTMDAKLCPDGSYVGRVGPNCEFAACPTGTTSSSVSGTVVGGATTTNSAPRTATITYTSSGFSPKTLIIADGGTVTFVNSSSENMRVASDPHPLHTNYPGFDQINPTGNGGMWSFTFTRVGSWGYHNHANPTQSGTIIVQ